MFFVLIWKDFSAIWNLCDRTQHFQFFSPKCWQQALPPPQCYTNVDTAASTGTNKVTAELQIFLCHSCIICACINHGRVGLFIPGFSKGNQGCISEGCALKTTKPTNQTKPNSPRSYWAQCEDKQDEIISKRVLHVWKVVDNFCVINQDNGDTNWGACERDPRLCL